MKSEKVRTMNEKGQQDQLLPYYFDDDKNAIVVTRQDTPRPWINYMSNGNLHAFVSQAGGGLLWWKSATKGRLTRYRAFQMPVDGPGFYLYLRDQDGSCWSPTLRPCDTPVDTRHASHRPGMTEFYATRNGLTVTLSLFIAPDYPALLWDVRINNTTQDPRSLDIFAYSEFSQLNWEKELRGGYYVQHMMKGWFEKEGNAVCFLDHDWEPYFDEKPLTYFMGSDPVESFCSDRDAFFGPYGSEGNPAVIRAGACGNNELDGGNGCGALHHNLFLEAGEQRRFHYAMGVLEGANQSLSLVGERLGELAAKLRLPETIDEQRAKSDKWWADHLSILQCSVPDSIVQRQINIWNPVNSVHTARYSRGINTWAPGTRGLGFRDTAQDMLAIAYRRPEWAAGMLKTLLSYQYPEGRAVHTLFPDDHEPADPSLRSDNHLWLPLVVHAIIAEVGEASLLNEKVPFYQEIPEQTGPTGTVWEHLLAAMKFTESNLGDHGLPLIFESDWNDLIGKFNQTGRGETTFAGFQYVHALRLLLEIAAFTGNKEDESWLHGCLERQEAALLKHGWDGQWWIRGFDDDGAPIGSSANDPSRIFLNPQSWAVISGVGTAAQHRAGMGGVAERLNLGFGLKILDPAFDGWVGNDTLVGYGPGCGENGAVFCHANTWAIIAEALCGNAERAWEYFTQLIPQNVISRLGLKTYRAEPYAWVSNIVGPGNGHEGWGNVEHISGTAPWMDIASTQYLLGIRPELGGLRMDPRIPGDWKSLEVRRRYRGCDILIRIQNQNGSGSGNPNIRIDGSDVSRKGCPVVSPVHFQGKSKATVDVLID